MSDLFCFTGAKEMNKTKSAVLSSVQYIIIFVGFVLSYMFTYPQYDVLLFTRDFKGDIRSVLSEAVYYGNGRFLGNVLGFYLSHHFTAAFFVTAFFLTLIVFLSNKLFFEGNEKTIFPIAVTVAFPAVGLIREVYCMIAAFCNYAVPLVFALMSAIFIKKLKSNGSRLFYIPLAFSAVGVCLFSENTTVVVLCASFLLVAVDFINDKKVSTPSIVNLAYSAVGALIMYLIPRLTDTEEKLDYYRGYVDKNSLISNMISTLRSFALLANQYAPVYLIISAAVIYVLYRYCRTGKFIKLILTAIFVTLPTACVFALIFAQKANELAAVYLPLEAVYLVAVLIVSILSKRRNLIVSVVVTVILLGSAVAPMTVVNHRGDRTFFTTFAILFCYALYLVKEIGIGEKIRRAVCAVSAAAFAVGCCVLLVMTAQNFDCYAYRADYLAQKSVTSSSADVPYLAHGRLAQETALGQIDPCLFGSSVCMSFNVASADEWEMSDEYEKLANLSPVSAVKYGLAHWKFKDATYPLKLHEKYSQNK